LIAFDKAPSVYIDHHTLPTPFTSQKVEPADSLTKRLNDISGILYLLRSQLGDEAGLLPIGITPD
jgi:hypothetical protein